MKSFDIVIRCKNEIVWLPYVFDSISNQTIKPNKIVFVDDSSSDGSIEFANQYGCHVVDYGDQPFNYSQALNIGIMQSDADMVLLLSAHCVLYNAFAIEKLMQCIDLFSAAGVFGRQIPTNNSTNIDARDLLTVFGRERIVYEKYPFFHNAFSLIDRSVWKDIPFSINTNGIEDRLWAYNVCSKGYKVIYEPSAIVYHEHGLNQGLDSQRAKRVYNSLKTLHKDDTPISQSKSFILKKGGRANDN